MCALNNTISVALIMGLFGGIAVQGQTGTVVGIVHATGRDGEIFAIPGVRLTLTCGSEAAPIIVSNEQGEFRFANVPVGRCSLVTDAQGFKPVSASFNSAAAERIDLPVSLELEVLYTGLTVTRGPLDEPLNAGTDESSTSRASSSTESRECRHDAGAR